MLPYNQESMSTNEKDELYGRKSRELKEARRHLGCLETKRDELAQMLRHAAERLYEVHCYGPRTLHPDLPTKEERCEIVNEIEAAKEQVAALEDCVRKIEP